MPGHAWPRPPKICQSTCSSHGALSLCTKSGWYLIRFWRYLNFKNPAIWLAESIFEHNLRTRFFPDMRFSQKVDNNYGASFKTKKSTHQWTKFFAKSKKHHFWGIFGHYTQNEIFFKKFGFVTFSLLRYPNFMQSFEKSYEQFLRKLVTDWQTDWLTVVIS